ncbi:MAG TPA: alcohol dehydrogenase catalytic domain-containing protein [Candidatus Eisenbacteria bacterium]|nr:alcohol dehydrogenase catalytic domain-containing protein [Candidatus Eisenbacteria bacterium]
MPGAPSDVPTALCRGDPLRALTFRGIRTIRYETVPEPTLLDDGDAMVQVECAGLCGSDLHVYHGRETGLDEGTVMGHEFVGRIVAAGPEVRGHAIGTRVVAPFSTCCGRCFFCIRGLSARCRQGALLGWVENGVGLQGAQTEFIRVPHADATLLAIDESLPAELALLLTDVVPTGWHVSRLGRISAGDVVVVLGCGPVGLAAAVAAFEQGAGRVFAVDAVPERLELAARFGAEPLELNQLVGPTILDATDGRGADAALEVVGSADASRLAFELVRPGGIVAIAGVHHESRFSFSPLEAYNKNLTLSIGRCPARSLMEELLPLLRRRSDLGAIVTHRRPLKDGPEAYEMFDLKRGGCVKVVFEP